MKREAKAVIERCNQLRAYWAPRDEKMKAWYRLIQMVDELKTAKMESFVGNDPRSMFNLVLHMLDTPIPHRLRDFGDADLDMANMSASVSGFLNTAWADVEETFRHTGPRQSLKRSMIGLLLATGWYSCWTAFGDDGDRAYLDLWNPAQVYPMWDSDLGLAEVAHIYAVSAERMKRMQKANGWIDLGAMHGDQTIQDYWWMEMDGDNWSNRIRVWNAVVASGKLVKYEPTRFTTMPIYVAPVGGLPDTGPLSADSESSTTFSAGAHAKGERWKEEIGQSVVATNEYIYKSWNKWWSFSLQLMRDTAQPRIFEKSRSGKAIVKPEDIWRRGAIFRGGPDDAVEFIGTPPMPMELRSTQLDLEAMMQRGGVSWAMYGSVTGQMTTYVMGQIAASANQMARPFHEAIQNLVSDIGNAWLKEVRDRGIRPYGWTVPAGLPQDAYVISKFEIEIPGDLVRRATEARMLDAEFGLSYTYVVEKLFPDIQDPLRERARRLADKAELSDENATIAQIRFYRRQAAFLRNLDAEAAKLYEMAAEAAEAQLLPQQPQQQPQRQIGARTEGAPPVERPPLM